MIQKQNIKILEKVKEIEQDIQSLKIEYFLNLPEKQRKGFEIYKDKEILDEVKKIRKNLWNEKYSKIV